MLASSVSTSCSSGLFYWTTDALQVNLLLVCAAPPCSSDGRPLASVREYSSTHVVGLSKDAIIGIIIAVGAFAIAFSSVMWFIFTTPLGGPFFPASTHDNARIGPQAGFESNAFQQAEEQAVVGAFDLVRPGAANERHQPAQVLPLEESAHRLQGGPAGATLDDTR